MIFTNQIHRPEFTSEPTKCTLSPTIITGNIIAMKYKDGVIAVTDNQASYGAGHSHARNIKRYDVFGDFALLVSSGEYSDFQQLGYELQKKVKNDTLMDDGIVYTAKELAHYAASLLYKKRNDFDPLYSSNIICGHRNGSSYVSITDMFGNKFEKDIVMSGLAEYLCTSLARKYYSPDMDEETAKAFLTTCMNVIFVKNRLCGNQSSLPLISVCISRPSPTTE